MKYLTTAEARELGVIQEVNRVLLHPRGLALEVEWQYGTTPETDGGVAVLHVQDHRDDPEGVYFDLAHAGADDVAEAHAKANAFAEVLRNIGETRFKALRFIVEPIPPDTLPRTLRGTHNDPKGDT